MTKYLAYFDQLEGLVGTTFVKITTVFRAKGSNQPHFVTIGKDRDWQSERSDRSSRRKFAAA